MPRQANLQLLQERDAEIQRLKEELREAREAAAQAEVLQHEAEADMLLHHCLQDDSEEEEDAARRLREQEEEVVWIKDIAEMFSIELQESKDARAEELARHDAEVHGFKELLKDADQELVVAKAETATWRTRWWKLTSVTQLNMERLVRSQQELKERCALDSSDDSSNASEDEDDKSVHVHQE